MTVIEVDCSSRNVCERCDNAQGPENALWVLEGGLLQHRSVSTCIQFLSKGALKRVSGRIPESYGKEARVGCER